MKRNGRLLAGIAIGALMVLTLFEGTPARAQMEQQNNIQAHLQKAMDTLNRLQQLLDRIANRQSAQQSNQNTMQDSNSGNNDSQ